MALTSYLLERSMFDDMFIPTVNYNQPFLPSNFVGGGLQPQVDFLPFNSTLGTIRDFIRDFSVPLRSGYLRPWRHLSTQNSGQSKIFNDKDNFKVNLDVQQFKPEELSVKVVDKFIVVEGKHEERSDEHGFVSRQFTRRYRLPRNVDKKAITSSLSSDGVLQLCAPKVPTPEGASRSIPIKQAKQLPLKTTPIEETIKQTDQLALKAKPSEETIKQSNQPAVKAKASEVTIKQTNQPAMKAKSSEEAKKFEKMETS